MTPARFVFLVALIGSSAVVVYGLFIDRSGQTIALTVAGLAVLGVTLAMLAVWLGQAGMSSARRGSTLRGVGWALVGGVCALAASGALGAAAIFGMLAV